MKNPAKELFIKKIEQKNNTIFSIEWCDGTVKDYLLEELQKQCPCAQCTQQPLHACMNQEVRAKRIHSVGRYALRIQFTSGCSAGIYSYELLYHFVPGKSQCT